MNFNRTFYENQIDKLDDFKKGTLKTYEWIEEDIDNILSNYEDEIDTGSETVKSIALEFINEFAEYLKQSLSSCRDDLLIAYVEDLPDEVIEDGKTE